MNVSGFTASADIVGRRVRVGWDFVPEVSETLADIPPVTLRRKLGDYAFPTAVPDPYLVYDSTTFPPAPIPGALTVTDLPSWQIAQNSSLTVFEPVSVAISVGGRLIEVLRRTIGTTYDASGTPVQQHVEILDTGQSPGALLASTVYYYQLFSLNLPTSGADAGPYRSSALVTDTYGLNRTLYESLPEIYRRHDVQTRPTTPGGDSVPEQASRFGQLRRFTDLFGVALDSIRGGADGLWTLHDLDRVDGRYLPLLAQWIAWELSVDSEIPVQRNEIKTAARLYKLVGTLPGLRALVSQYTGWFAQVTEFAQNLTLSNQPPLRNLFGITLGSGGTSWHGVNDASDALGFGAANQSATGSGGTAAALTSTFSEPFELRPGMSLTAAVDGLLPATVRFGSGDFADPANATAAEVAAAIERGLPELIASVSAGSLVLSSETAGVQSQVQIIPESSSLISLQHAPSGRLGSLTDSLGRVRIFYETWDTPSQPASTAPTTAAASAGASVQRRLYYKTLLNGLWLDSHPVFSQTVTPQADPASALLPNDRIWIAWVDNPQTTSSQLRFALGDSNPLAPARLLGLRRPPFVLVDGAVLALVGAWSGSDSFTVHAADFANLAQATTAEVVSAMNAQLTHAVAAAQSDGSLRIETIAGGPQARLAVDLQHSTTARALGFDNRNNIGSPGSWSEQINWSPAFSVPSVGPGHHGDLTAISDPAGGVRLAWAYYLAGLWRVQAAHWADQTMVGTANGLFLRASAGPWTAIAGLPSSDVRSVAVDSSGVAWIATGAGVALRSPAGTISALGVALPSTNIRSVKLGRDGAAWFATDAGVAVVALDGSLTTLTSPGVLPSNDVRGVALGDGGYTWIATGAGLAVRNPSGTVTILNTASGLPSNDVRDAAVGADGTAYAATAAGLSIMSPGGSSTVIDATNGLASSDVRALAIDANGTLLAATAAGLSRRVAGVWRTVDTASGLPNNDTRSVAFAPDGSIWVGTAVGVSIIAPDSTITSPDLSGSGAANPPAQSIQTGWSSPFELGGDGGANREPAVAIDENNRTWLVWSKLAAAGDPNEIWSLHYRIFDPATGAWGVDTPLTAPPAGGRASDRTPSILQIPGGMRVFFASDRNSGSTLFSVDITLAGVVSPMISITNTASSDCSPTPVLVGGAAWLLYRSDRNVALTQVGFMSPLVSERVPDNGTLRRYAGSVTVTPGNLTRNRMRGLFGDLLNYSPNRPAGGSLSDSELYTRGTVGIYVSKANQGSPLTQQEASRLRVLLASLIPVNMRAVIIIVAPSDLEFIYFSGSDIQESYTDVYPFAETLGAIQESSAAAMPGVVVMLASTAGNISVNPLDLTTLRRRSFFPPIT